MRGRSTTRDRPSIVFLQLDGEIFFAVAEALQDRLDTIAQAGVLFVVLRLKLCHSIDATALHVLDRTARDLCERGGQLLLCGVRDEVMSGLVGYGLADLIGPANLFASGADLYASSRRATGTRKSSRRS